MSNGPWFSRSYTTAQNRFEKGDRVTSPDFPSPGVVVETSGRRVAVKLDDPGTWTNDAGKTISNASIVNIQTGTPGYDRITKE